MSKNWNLSDLQIIIFNSPYDSLEMKDTQYLFSKLMALKVRGYSKVHDQNPLPFATCDFIGTHLLVCGKENPMDNIYMSYKSVSLNQCLRFNLDFPFLSILQKSKNEICYEAMKSIVDECINNKENISYDTGWTIDPGVRENPELQIALKEIVTTFVINHHKQYGIDHWVTFGICKVKTDLFFLEMGLEEISASPFISHPYLGNVQARAVICKDHNYSLYTHRTAKKYQFLWDQKLEVGIIPDKKKVAA